MITVTEITVTAIALNAGIQVNIKTEISRNVVNSLAIANRALFVLKNVKSEYKANTTTITVIAIGYNKDMVCLLGKR
tara:strand:- start:222139 stop:222369 length:231 start_codon:yes stop_codon:yes gene_type:complete